jgi:hypothetical protein
VRSSKLTGRMGDASRNGELTCAAHIPSFVEGISRRLRSRDQLAPSGGRTVFPMAVRPPGSESLNGGSADLAHGTATPHGAVPPAYLYGAASRRSRNEAQGLERHAVTEIRHDSSLVAYKYASTRRILDVIVRQVAGRTSRELAGSMRAPFLPAQVSIERPGDMPLYQLVRKAEELLEFGSLDKPDWYIRDTAYIECSQLRTLREGYRVAFVKNLAIEGKSLLILVGSLDNLIGVQPNGDPSPAGLYPHDADMLESMLQQFTDKNRHRRQLELPDEPDRIKQLVTVAADFAFHLGDLQDCDLEIFSGWFDFGAQVWFAAEDVTVRSPRHGARWTYPQVLVGTPLWVRGLSLTQCPDSSQSCAFSDAKATA